MPELNAAIAVLCFIAAAVAGSYPIGIAYVGFGVGYVGLALFYYGVTP